MSSSASNKKVDAGGSILIHHSRNTAQKQWAETQVYVYIYIYSLYSDFYVPLFGSNKLTYSRY